MCNVTQIYGTYTKILLINRLQLYLMLQNINKLAIQPLLCPVTTDHL